MASPPHAANRLTQHEWEQIFSYVPLVADQLNAVDVFDGAIDTDKMVRAIVSVHRENIFANHALVHHLFEHESLKGTKSPYRYDPVPFVSMTVEERSKFVLERKTFKKLIKEARDEQDTVKEYQLSKAQELARIKHRKDAVVRFGDLKAVVSTLRLIPTHKGRGSCRGCLVELRGLALKRVRPVPLPPMCDNCYYVYINQTYVVEDRMDALGLNTTILNLPYLRLAHNPRMLEPVLRFGWTGYYSQDTAETMSIEMHGCLLKDAERLPDLTIKANEKIFEFCASVVEHIMAFYDSSAVSIVMQLFALFKNRKICTSENMHLVFFTAIRECLVGNIGALSIDTIFRTFSAYVASPDHIKEAARNFWILFPDNRTIMGSPDGPTFIETFEALVWCSSRAVIIRSHLSGYDFQKSLPPFLDYLFALGWLVYFPYKEALPAEYQNSCFDVCWVEPVVPVGGRKIV